MRQWHPERGINPQSACLKPYPLRIVEVDIHVEVT